MILTILDGWGYSSRTIGNPLNQANTPTLDSITVQFPMTLLQASGLAVGMTWGETGNSEVGHLNIGAGRIVEQYYSRINRTIKDQSFFSNPAFAGAFEYAKKNSSSVHIIGLLTTNTVHAAFNHLATLISMAASYNPVPVFIHLFLDGRDSGLQEGAEMLTKLNEEIAKSGCGKVAAIIGRDFAMDRDNNWDRTQKTFDLLVLAKGESTEDIIASVNKNYEQGTKDSKMPPLVSKSSGFSGIRDKDALIFFNFREDSMRQLVTAFADPEFSVFPRPNISGLYVATMTQYLENPNIAVAISPPIIKNNLAEAVSLNNKTQLHIAETDKYAHVTYFFNGLRNAAFTGETDVFIDSVKDIEKKPEMSCAEVADRVIQSLELNAYDFIVLNFANADLLAHTGNYDATVKGIEAVDAALGKIYEKVLKKNLIMAITADHGNAESMIYKKSGEAETKHDDSPVAFYLVANEFKLAAGAASSKNSLTEINGILPDVAPTILELMKISVPDEMSGKSLLQTLGIKL